MDEIRKYEVDMLMKNLEWAETEGRYRYVVNMLTELYEETPHSEYLCHHLALALTGYAVGFKMKDPSWESQKETFESIQDALAIDPEPDPQFYSMQVLALMTSALSMGITAATKVDFDMESLALEYVEEALKYGDEECMKNDLWIPNRSLPAVASVMAFHLSGAYIRRGTFFLDQALEMINKSLDYCRFEQITRNDFNPSVKQINEDELVLSRQEIVKKRSEIIARMMESP